MESQWWRLWLCVTPSPPRQVLDHRRVLLFRQLHAGEPYALDRLLPGGLATQILPQGALAPKLRKVGFNDHRRHDPGFELSKRPREVGYS